MTTRAFSRLGEEDRARALDVLVLAFSADPVERWMYPEPREYLNHFPAFLSAFAGNAFAEESVWSLGEFSAVALWLPPGTEPDGDAIVAVLTESVAPEKQEDVLAVLGQMDEAHPSFAHWYLPWLGVDPAQQGQGLGGELMESCLRSLDEDRLPVYLETPNPRSIPFYERFGFETTGAAQAGGCPPITFMLRGAR
jgi:ribosomal protein S18 acetylase RimI-like enzyme